MDLCEACEAALPCIESACLRCGIPLPIDDQQATCGQCQQTPPAFDSCLSLFRYEPPVDGLITGLKFNRRLVNARTLGALFVDRLMAEKDGSRQASSVAPPIKWPEAILPVPLHRSRLRERGFNQALEIARPVARRLKIPLLKNYCERTRATAEQSTLPAKERQKNVRGVFEVMRGSGYEHIAIVDDVMTTGQTVNELATVLRQSGVKRIDVWVCARAQLK